VTNRFGDALVSRRALLLGGLSLPAVLAACSSGDDREAATRAAPTARRSDGTPPTTVLAPTPACGDDDEPTPSQTEGPFFTPDSPQKASFRADVDEGTPIVLSGFVVTPSCQPLERALLDVWHADDGGNYDSDGYRLRGHFFTDAQGRYRLETIVPGLYPGRTRHFHAKVRGPAGPVLTTQLYFPGEAGNDRDEIYRPELLMDVRERPTGKGKEATFTFVVEA
jgi:protocatechuate 3,4-dioxygenase beta subunit